MFAQASWYFANPENLQVFKLISQVIKDFASSEINQASKRSFSLSFVSLDRGGIKRAQELANEKGESALKNLKYLPRSGFRSALEDMVMFNLENID
ncbi:unnamed protein product [Brassica napus]|uniref:(rape) hypothetical protein n=1 Tax=Brassica napus TaxID=3708 RepID=A0A816USV4_BRANA|nr:unnamed protein product [Brassica napus]